MTDLNDHNAALPDWTKIAAALQEDGWTALPGFISAPQAEPLAALIDTIGTGRHALLSAMKRGRGELCYLATPWPESLLTWRARMYAPLASIANQWHEVLGISARFPASFNAFLALNIKAGQTLSLSALSRLGPYDYQALHQHAQGTWVFPLQRVILLSDPGEDFTGGEFVMTEQRPRMQSRPPRPHRSPASRIHLANPFDRLSA